MADYWIISTHPFREHKSLETAKVELARLLAEAPNKPFRIRRVKTSLEPNNPPQGTPTRWFDGVPEAEPASIPACATSVSPT